MGDQPLGERRQPGQRAAHPPGGLLQGEHGLRRVLVPVAGPALLGEPERDGGLVLGHGPDETVKRHAQDRS